MTDYTRRDEPSDDTDFRSGDTGAATSASPYRPAPLGFLPTDPTLPSTVNDRFDQIARLQAEIAEEVRRRDEAARAEQRRLAQAERDGETAYRVHLVQLEDRKAALTAHQERIDCMLGRTRAPAIPARPADDPRVIPGTSSPSAPPTSTPFDAPAPFSTPPAPASPRRTDDDWDRPDHSSWTSAGTPDHTSQEAASGNPFPRGTDRYADKFSDDVDDDDEVKPDHVRSATPLFGRPPASVPPVSTSVTPPTADHVWSPPEKKAPKWVMRVLYLVLIGALLWLVWKLPFHNFGHWWGVALFIVQAIAAAALGYWLANKIGPAIKGLFTRTRRRSSLY